MEDPFVNFSVLFIFRHLVQIFSSTFYSRIPSPTRCKTEITL